MNLHLNVYFICFVCLFTLRNILELFAKFGKEYKHNKKEQGLGSLIAFILSYLTSGIAVGIFLLVDNEVISMIYIAGILIFIFAYIGRIFTLITIGDNYSQFIIPLPDSCLVTSNMYSFIRHPLYMFYAFEMVAFLIIKFNYISLIALCVDIVATLHRVEKEEVLLYNKFGEDFVNYQNRTKKLIPFIY